MRNRFLLGLLAIALLSLAGYLLRDSLAIAVWKYRVGKATAAVGVMDGHRSYRANNGEIWTEYSITVKRSYPDLFPPGSQVKALRRGGSLVAGKSPSGEQKMEVVLVDDGIVLPSPGDDLFAVVKVQGDGPRNGMHRAMLLRLTR